ncbi:hypothetical protein [Methanobrevibacter sp.]
MTEKRFILLDGVKLGTRSGIFDNQKENNERIGDELWLGEVVGMLNEGVMIAKENEELKSEIETLHEQLAHFDLNEVIWND